MLNRLSRVLKHHLIAFYFGAIAEYQLIENTTPCRTTRYRITTMLRSRLKTHKYKQVSTLYNWQPIACQRLQPGIIIIPYPYKTTSRRYSTKAS